MEHLSKAALTRREIQILVFLGQRAAPVSSRTILTDVFGYKKNVTSHTVETHIWRLRSKIEEDPKNPKILQSVRGGYVLGAQYKQCANALTSPKPSSEQ